MGEKCDCHSVVYCVKLLRREYYNKIKTNFNLPYSERGIVPRARNKDGLIKAASVQYEKLNEFITSMTEKDSLLYCSLLALIRSSLFLARSIKSPFVKL